MDPFEYVSIFERVQALGAVEKEAALKEMNVLMRDFPENYLQAARDFAEAGCYEEAVAMLDQCTKEQPMLAYYKGYFYGKMGQDEQRILEYLKAEQTRADYCFPNKLEDIAVLQDAMEQNPQGAKAYYYLGCLYYDKRQQEKAIALWEKSITLDNSYPTVHRNLALGYFNILGEKAKAKRELEAAFALDQSDSRVFLELDQLYKKLNVDFEIGRAHV